MFGSSHDHADASVDTDALWVPDAARRVFCHNRHNVDTKERALLRGLWARNNEQQQHARQTISSTAAFFAGPRPRSEHLHPPMRSSELLSTGSMKKSPTTCSYPISLIIAFTCGAMTVGLIQPLLSKAFITQAVETVEFSFQVLGIVTPRQNNKTANVFVRFRYSNDERFCPFSPTDNTCVQYQFFMRSTILNITQHPTVALPMEAEWERVNLAICRALWGQTNPRRYPNIVALSTAFHVNGDGRSAAERGIMPYEPGAHGSTCTIGPDGIAAGFEPVHFYNRLPNLGPL